MSNAQSVSRRTSVKTLALAGVAMASGIVSQAASAATAQPLASPEKGAPPSGPVDVALARFAKGHSCAQAVFTAHAEAMGLDYQTARKISSGFGGGMYQGSVCGAVSGAFMALGLKYGADPNVDMAKLVREFTARFKAKHPSINCAELLGTDLSKIDLSDPEQVKALKEKLTKDKNPYALCGSFVRDAAEIVAEMTKGA